MNERSHTRGSTGIAGLAWIFWTLFPGKLTMFAV